MTTSLAHDELVDITDDWIEWPGLTSRHYAASRCS
jgi:hypothetical protein